jgi:hypothetical protein
MEEVPKKSPEEIIPKPESPILHSMKRDTISGAQTVVGSNDVPAEEAVLLAKMQEASLKKRKLSYLTVLGIILVLIGIGVFALPDKFFARKDTDVVVTKNKVQNFLSTDATYSIDKPTESELATFKEKSFAGKRVTPGIKTRKNRKTSTRFIISKRTKN